MSEGHHLALGPNFAGDFVEGSAVMDLEIGGMIGGGAGHMDNRAVEVWLRRFKPALETDRVHLLKELVPLRHLAWRRPRVAFSLLVYVVAVRVALVILFAFRHPFFEVWSDIGPHLLGELGDL